MAWLVVAYLGSLAVLLVSAFWTRSSFTGAVLHEFTTDNVVRVLTDDLLDRIDELESASRRRRTPLWTSTS